MLIEYAMAPTDSSWPSEICCKDVSNHKCVRLFLGIHEIIDRIADRSFDGGSDWYYSVLHHMGRCDINSFAHYSIVLVR